jgi:hypothetical protein
MDSLKKKKIIFVVVAVVVLIVVFIGFAALVGHYTSNKKPLPSAASSTIGTQQSNDQALIALRAPICQKFSNLADALKTPDVVCFLDLTNQKLTAFPTDILKFKNLEYLDLADNSIPSVPPEIAQLSKLNELWLGNNQLTSLPSEIGDMSGLTLLSLFENKLTSLPPSVANLKNLMILGITGNPIDGVGKAAAKKMLPKTNIL